MVYSKHSVLPNSDANKTSADRYATWTTRTAQNTVRNANEIVKKNGVTVANKYTTATETHTPFILTCRSINVTA